jgi:hypothetical protein
MACSLAVCLYLGHPAVVLAEPTADLQTRVEQLIQLGMQRRQAGLDADALESYRQAAALEPDNARVLAHIGVTYQALGRWVSALAYLMQALARSEEPYIRSHQSELREALDIVEGHLGRLEVYGGPPGAETSVNGQLVGRLPMAAPVPITAGSYLLEVRAAGHYGLSRPISVVPRSLTREEVQLTPQRAETLELSPSGDPKGLASGGVGVDAGSSAPLWLPWVLGGSSAVAFATTIVAWRAREHYVGRWNDDDHCLAIIGVRREERCGGDFDRGKRAETVAWVSGAAAGALAAGAVISALLVAVPEEAVAGSGSGAASSGCVPTLSGAACFGTF